MLTADLSEFRRVFTGNFIELVVSERLWQNSGRSACFAKEAVQASRRHDPEQEQFVIGVRKSVPGVFRNEDRSALLEAMMYVVQ